MKDFRQHLIFILISFLSWLLFTSSKQALIMTLYPLYFALFLAAVYILRYQDQRIIPKEYLKKEIYLLSSILLILYTVFRYLKFKWALDVAFQLIFYEFFLLILLQIWINFKKIKKEH